MAVAIFNKGIFDLSTIPNFQITMKREQKPATRAQAHGVGGLFISLYIDKASLVDDIILE